METAPCGWIEFLSGTSIAAATTFDVLFSPYCFMKSDVTFSMLFNSELFFELIEMLAVSEPAAHAGAGATTTAVQKLSILKLAIRS